MSKKIRDTKKTTPAAPTAPGLSNDPDSLVKEWRNANQQVANLASQIKSEQAKIQQAQQQIQALEKTGLQIVGQVSVLTRILEGMGVDPATYELAEENSEGEKTPEDAENSGEVVDISADNPKKTPPNRFRKS